jgi:hypothetical protein
MSGTNPSQGWNYGPLGPVPLTGLEQLLMAQNASAFAPVLRYPANAFAANATLSTVLAYGAKGDGVTDDTTAIQTAINATAGASLLLFPKTAAFYLISLPLVVPSYSWLLIEGTVQIANGANCDIFQIPAGTNIAPTTNIIIEGNGVLDGNAANNSTHGGGITGSSPITGNFHVDPTSPGYWPWITNLTVRNLTIQNCHNWPFNMSAVRNGLCENVKMTTSGNTCEWANGCVNCAFVNCTVATIADLAMGLYGGAHACAIINCTVYDCVSSGPAILADNGQPVQCADNLIQGNTSYGHAGSGIGLASNLSLSPWQANHAYTTAARIFGVTGGVTYMFSCTTAGTSGSSQPTWPTSGTITDNTVVWTWQCVVNGPTTGGNQPLRTRILGNTSYGNGVFTSTGNGGPAGFGTPGTRANGAAGILAFGVATRVMGNTCYGNYWNATYGGDLVINVNSDSSVVTGNTVYNTCIGNTSNESGFGIVFFNGALGTGFSNYVSVTNNYISDTRAQPGAGWISSHAYALNATVTASPAGGGYYSFICTTAGTSGFSTPIWPASGTVTDGSVVWMSQGSLKAMGGALGGNMGAQCVIMNNTYGGPTGYLLDANGVSTADQLVYDVASLEGISADTGPVAGSRQIGNARFSGPITFQWGAADPSPPIPAATWPSTGLTIGWNRQAGVGETDLFCASGGQVPGGLRTFGLKTNLPPGWVALQVHSLGDVISASPPGVGLYIFICTTAGTSGGSAPTWPTSGTVTDGSVTWTTVGPENIPNPAWMALNAYSLGDVVTASPSGFNPYNFICTAAGTSGATTPVWPTSGTLTEGTVTWTTVGPVMVTGVIVPTTNGSNGQTADITGTGIIRAYGAFAESGFIDVPGAVDGGTYNIPDATGTLFFNHTGFAAFTFVMPPNPVLGQVQTICFAGTVTTLTISPNSGQTLLGAATAATANLTVSWIYRSSGAVWVRRQ